ncbi:MAG TPA: tripartite tricarboxylate transporter substrate binding protein [Burkholderiaceae bacterium]|nr:tripartite tricarboxylate transporter substrate binding protein [Burkholderiaceae bacterium]
MLFGAAALGAATAPAAVAAEDVFPSKPLQIVVPYGPGGVVDVLSRIVVDRMAAALGQAVVVQNRPGGNANIGPSLVAQAQPDGYTLLASSSATVINPYIEKNPGFGHDSFVPIARIAQSPNLIVVPASLEVATLADFVTLAKARPGLATPVTGPGSSQAVARALFAKSADIELLDVAYKGGVNFITDLLAGTLAMSVSPVNVVGRLVHEGKLVALANTAEQRSPIVPEVPTLTEAGYPEATSVSWFGLHAPAGTPASALDKIASAVKAATGDPEVVEKIKALGAEIAYLDKPAFEEFIASERSRAEKYAAEIKVAAQQ